MLFQVSAAIRIHICTVTADLRPGDPAYFDILHSFMGYRTCYYRTFAIGSASQAMVDAYKRCRYYLDVAIDAIKPGVTTADVVKLWPKAQEFGFPDENAAFALQYGHGIGLSIWKSQYLAVSFHLTIQKRSKKAWSSP